MLKIINKKQIIYCFLSILFFYILPLKELEKINLENFLHLNNFLLFVNYINIKVIQLLNTFVLINTYIVLFPILIGIIIISFYLKIILKTPQNRSYKIMDNLYMIFLGFCLFGLIFIISFPSTPDEITIKGKINWNVLNIFFAITALCISVPKNNYWIFIFTKLPFLIFIVFQVSLREF